MLFPDLFLPGIPLEFAILEKRVYDNVSGPDFLQYEIVDGLFRKFIDRIAVEDIVVIGESCGVRRENLVHAYDLIDGVAAAALIVKGFDRFGYFLLLEALDCGVVSRLELVDFKV